MARPGEECDQLSDRRDRDARPARQEPHQLAAWVPVALPYGPELLGNLLALRPQAAADFVAACRDRRFVRTVHRWLRITAMSSASSSRVAANASPPRDVWTLNRCHAIAAIAA